MIKARFLAGLIGIVAIGAGCSKDDSPPIAAAETPAEPETASAPAPAPAPTPTPTLASAPAASDAPLARPSPHASAMASALAKPAPTCGNKPLPPCPLNAWMKQNTSPAVIAEDFDGLATALEKVVTFAPEGYPNWASIAHDGADAARAQSLDGVKASCRGCHTQYKDRYKREMRDRPL